MRTVSLSELKANLSRYVREVQRGGEVQILHRGKPVARPGGVSGAGMSGSERRSRLIASGALRPGTGDASSILELPPILGDADLAGALEAEREDRL